MSSPTTSSEEYAAAADCHEEAAKAEPEDRVYWQEKAKMHEDTARSKDARERAQNK